jgi:protein SCO1
VKVPPLLNLLILFLVMATTTTPRQAIGAQSLGAGGGLLEATKSLLGGGEGDDGSSWITERIGEYLQLDLQFVDEEGRDVRLGDLIDRPTLFLPIYYYCPNICSKNLANLAVALGELRSRPGIDYRVIALSFSDVENSKDAADAKRNYIRILPENWPAEQWRFLTGTADAIKVATDGVGFRFKKIDDETFIHPAALMVIARDGKIIRYVYGSFLSGDIDIALASAAEGVPMMSVKRLLSFCFNYDPHGKTSIFEMVKIIVLVLFAMALGAVFLYYRRKGRPRGTAGSDNIQP